MKKGMKWDSECHDVYVVDINDDKFMVIDIQYFIEATEGWATRYVQLLKTLEIHKYYIINMQIKEEI
ncbi:MAG: hypothetical protein IKE91_04610 [Clostridia bacterium]|nr:hypothetical protein [Clostridia bacterium]